MIRRLVFHPAAAREAVQAQTWYAERSELAAEAFALEVDLVVRRVADAPERYAAYLKGTRRALFPRYPFSLVYRVSSDVIEVVAVAHQRRRPGYWQSRPTS